MEPDVGFLYHSIVRGLRRGMPLQRYSNDVMNFEMC